MSPSQNKTIEYKGIEDVEQELIRCYDECKDGGYKIGNALLTQSKFFVNTGLLLNHKYQNLIKKYNYSKLTNTPPYPSIKDTPYQFVNDIQTINEEIMNIEKWQQQTNTS